MLSLGLGLAGSLLTVGKFGNSPSLGYLILSVIILVANLQVLNWLNKLELDLLTIGLVILYVVSSASFIFSTKTPVFNVLLNLFLLVLININMILPKVWQSFLVKISYISLIHYWIQKIVGIPVTVIEAAKEGNGVSVPKFHVKNLLQIFLLFMIISLPTIFLVAALLSASSDTFSQILNDLTFGLDWELFFVRLVYIAIVAGYFITEFSFSKSLAEDTEKIDEMSVKLPSDWKRSIGLVLALTIFTLNLFYVLFIFAQLQYDIGNLQELIAARDIDSYAALAVSRFSELIIVSLINIALIYLGRESLAEWAKSKTADILNKTNIIFLLISTLLLIVSVFQRLNLYIQTYGLTYRRTSALLFLPFLVIVAVSIFVGLHYSKRRFQLDKVAFFAAITYITLLTSLPFTLIIAEYNYQSYERDKTQVFDASYTIPVEYSDFAYSERLLTLKSNDISDNDGLLTVITILEQDEYGDLSINDKSKLKSLLKKRVGEFKEEVNESSDWRELNLMRAAIAKRINDANL